MTIKPRTRNPWGSKGVLCPRCQRKNPPEGFYSNGYCKPCGAKYHNDRYWENPEREREKLRRYYQRHPERVKARAVRYGRKLKLEILERYGKACTCCGDRHQEFLTLDHINGGGNKDRKITGAGQNFYKWLRRRGYPEVAVRVLCFNCNMALGLFGYCPHQSTEAKCHRQ